MGRLQDPVAGRPGDQMMGRSRVGVHSTSWTFPAEWKLNRKMNEKLKRSNFIYIFLFLFI